MRQNARVVLIHCWQSQFVPFMYDFVTCNESVTALLLLNAILDDTVISVQNHTIPVQSMHVHNRSILHQYLQRGLCGLWAGCIWLCMYLCYERKKF